MALSSYYACGVVVVFLLFASLTSTVDAFAYVRKCEGNSGAIGVMQPRSPTNALFVFSTFGVPTVEVFQFATTISLPNITTVSCTNVSAALHAMLPTPTTAFAIMMPYILEFDDSSGDGTISASTPILQLAELVLSNITSDGPLAFNAASKDGVYSFNFSAHTGDGSDSYNPFLPYNNITVSAQFVINNFPYNGTNSKLAIPMMFLSSDPKYSLATMTSIDDEYTPTVFMRNELTATNAYILWKPVAFGSSALDPNNATFALPTDLVQSDSSVFAFLNKSVARGFFTGHNSKSTIVCFAEHKDGVSNFPFLSWAFNYGLGGPVEQGLSSGLLVTIFVTNGLPLLAFIGGGAYLLKKKCSQSRSGYSSLNVQRFNN